MYRFMNFVFAVILLSTYSNISSAVVVGTDDFDGGGNFTSRTITPDNSGSLGQFPSSRFDLFGIVDRFINEDIADDTLNGLPDDSYGILGANKLDNVFAIEDLTNPDNTAGTGQAVWTFDISGYTNLSLSMDMAAIGDFEAFSTTDRFIFSASIDGGTAQTVFELTANEGVNYMVTMESGTMYAFDREFFFDSTLWDLLDQAGEPVMNGDDLISFSDDDLDMDGFNDTNGFRSYNISNAMNMTSFNNDEFDESRPFKDPLAIVGGSDLTNQLANYSAAIAGEGTTLTLTLNAASDGGGEVFVFDNLLIEGDVDTGGPDADVIDDGIVDGEDFLAIQRGDFPGVTIADWEAQYGTAGGAVASVGAVPEPTALLLFGMALTLAGCVRRKA